MPQEHINNAEGGQGSVYHSSASELAVNDTQSIIMPSIENPPIRVGDDYYCINGKTPLLDRKMAKPILQEVELIMKKESKLPRKNRDKTMEFFYRNFDKVEKEESQ